MSESGKILDESGGEWEIATDDSLLISVKNWRKKMEKASDDLAKLEKETPLKDISMGGKDVDTLEAENIARWKKDLG